jgi:MFS family permease
LDYLHAKYDLLGHAACGRPFSDKRSIANILPLGMGLSLIGMLGIAFANHFWFVMLAVVFIGLGSAIFHPEVSRVVYFAAGGRRGFAQSVYQVGGNAGSSLAPLMTIFVFVPLGQFGAIWGTLFAGLAIAILLGVLPWYKRKLAQWEDERSQIAASKAVGEPILEKVSHPRVKFALGLLIFLVFARSCYIASISNYYQFFLDEHYGLTIKEDLGLPGYRGIRIYYHVGFLRKCRLCAISFACEGWYGIRLDHWTGIRHGGNWSRCSGQGCRSLRIAPCYVVLQRAAVSGPLCITAAQ